MCNKSIKMHGNEAKNIMHVIDLQTLSSKKLGIISLIKEKKKHIIDFFEWKIHFNLMPKVSGLSQYNLACIFHGHLNKILYKFSKCISLPNSHHFHLPLIEFQMVCT